MNELLKQLRESKEFQAVMEELKSRRPVIPAYSPLSTPEETAMLVERIKFETGRQNGFDLLHKLLTGKV